MDKKQALDIIAQATAAVVANLETHKQIQVALQTLESELFPVDVKEDNKVAKEKVK